MEMTMTKFTVAALAVAFSATATVAMAQAAADGLQKASPSAADAAIRERVAAGLKTGQPTRPVVSGLKAGATSSSLSAESSASVMRSGVAGVQQTK
jgi:hypothetical protein